MGKNIILKGYYYFFEQFSLRTIWQIAVNRPTASLSSRVAQTTFVNSSHWLRSESSIMRIPLFTIDELLFTIEEGVERAAASWVQTTSHFVCPISISKELPEKEENLISIMQPGRHCEEGGEKKDNKKKIGSLQGPRIWANILSYFYQFIADSPPRQLFSV